MKKRLLRGAIGLLATGLLLAGWAFIIEPARLVERHETLALPGWPATLSGFKVALVSDLHIGAPFIDADAIAALGARIDAWQPDLILIAGDVLVGHEPGAKEVSPVDAAAMLRGWKAPHGVWAVLGNHDWWIDGEGTTRALEAVGVRVLENQAAPIDTSRGRLWVAGLADVWTRKTDAARALSFVTDDAPVVAFTHNPDVFPTMPSRFSIVLAGHTHGGQVRFPLVGRLVVPSEYGQRYAAGLKVEDGRSLFVTTGVGTSVLPVRFGVPPEVALLTFVPAP